MADLKVDLLKAVAILFFALSFAMLAAAYADWRWPESNWPMEQDPEMDVLAAIVFILMGVLAIVYRRWRQKQQNALER